MGLTIDGVPHEGWDSQPKNGRTHVNKEKGSLQAAMKTKLSVLLDDSHEEEQSSSKPSSKPTSRKPSISASLEWWTPKADDKKCQVRTGGRPPTQAPSRSLSVMPASAPHEPKRVGASQRRAYIEKFNGNTKQRVRVDPQAGFDTSTRIVTPRSIGEYAAERKAPGRPMSAPTHGRRLLSPPPSVPGQSHDASPAGRRYGVSQTWQPPKPPSPPLAPQDSAQRSEDLSNVEEVREIVDGGEGGWAGADAEVVGMFSEAEPARETQPAADAQGNQQRPSSAFASARSKSRASFVHRCPHTH
jgi:hypothetical protein